MAFVAKKLVKSWSKAGQKLDKSWSKVRGPRGFVKQIRGVKKLDKNGAILGYFEVFWGKSPLP